MNQMLVKISLPIAILFLLISCGGAQQERKLVEGSSYAENISPDKFKAMIEKPDRVTILDVRTNKECGEGMIEGATQINFYAGDFKTQISKLPKDKPVLVYCAVGGRSGSAVKMLHDAGIQKVYNLDGGIDAWRKKGYPTINK